MVLPEFMYDIIFGIISVLDYKERNIYLQVLLYFYAISPQYLL